MTGIKYQVWAPFKMIFEGSYSECKSVMSAFAAYGIPDHKLEVIEVSPNESGDDDLMNDKVA